MTKKMATVAILTTAALLASACSGGSASSSGGSDQIDTQAVAKFSHPLMPLTLDPHQINGNALGQNWLYDTLLLEDPKGELLPGLATSWDVSEDGLAITLAIRDGVSFNDGTPVDAAAVKTSLDRARTLQPSSSAGLLTAISDVAATDDDTVTISLSRPDSSLLAKLTTPAGSVVSPAVLKAGTDLTSADHDAGSTPYHVVDFEPGQKLVVERSKPESDYWDDEGWRIKRLEGSTAENMNTLLAGLKTGAYTEGFVVQPLDQLKGTIAGTPNLDVLQIDTDNIDALWINPNRVEQLGDPAVRRAISQVIDREQLASSGALAQDCKPTSQIYGPANIAHLEGSTELDYDPAKAKATLKAAGPFTVTVQTSSQNPAYKAYATYLEQELPKYGVTVKIVDVPLTQGVTDFLAGKVDVNTTGLPGYLDPGWAMDFTYMTGVPGTFKLPGASSSDRAEAAEKIDAANSLPLGSAERTTALQDAHRYLLEQAWQISTCQNQLNLVFDKRLKGVDVDTLTKQYGRTINARSLYMTK